MKKTLLLLFLGLFVFISYAEGTYYFDDKDHFKILGIRYYDFGQTFDKIYPDV